MLSFYGEYDERLNPEFDYLRALDLLPEAGGYGSRGEVMAVGGPVVRRSRRVQAVAAALAEKVRQQVIVSDRGRMLSNDC